MEVTFLGMNCVRLTGKDISVISDPFPKTSGLPEIKLANDVTLLSQKGLGVPQKPGMVLDGPGEYEVKETMITNIPAKLHIDHDKEGDNSTIFIVNVDGIRSAILGNVAPELNDKQLKAIGEVDVLIIPVGRHGLTLDATAAAQIISRIEPKYVIPTHYDDGKAKYDVPQDKLDVFMKEVGSTSEPQAKLRILQKDLPLETTVAVLQPQG